MTAHNLFEIESVFGRCRWCVSVVLSVKDLLISGALMLFCGQHEGQTYEIILLQ